MHNSCPMSSTFANQINNSSKVLIIIRNRSQQTWNFFNNLVKKSTGLNLMSNLWTNDNSPTLSNFLPDRPRGFREQLFPYIEPILQQFNSYKNQSMGIGKQEN